MWLELHDVARSFGARRAVDGLSLQLAKGLDRLPAGPEWLRQDHGVALYRRFRTGRSRHRFMRTAVCLRNRASRCRLPSRHIGMVFQDYALFPHLTVRRTSHSDCTSSRRGARTRRAEEMLATVGLDRLSRHSIRISFRAASSNVWRWRGRWRLSPSSSCSTSRSRVSMSNCASGLSAEVRAVLKSLNATALLVTHDQQEAFAVADLVGVMRDGRLEQWDAPYELYHRPATRFVADFIGQGVFIAGEIVSAAMPCRRKSV